MLKRNPFQIKKFLLFSIPLILFILSTSASNTRGIKRIENFIYDFPFQWNTSPHQTNIAIVGITQDSLEVLGKYPWPRSVYANLINRLTDMGAKIIVFDISFTVASKRKEEDNSLLRSIKKSGNVILPVFAEEIKEKKNEPGIYEANRITHNLPLLEKNSLGIGHINVILDEDGTVRRIPLFIQHGHQIFPSLSLISYMRFKNINTAKLLKGYLLCGGKKIPLDSHNCLLINHYANPFSVLHFHEVLSGDLPASYFRGKIVIVGQVTEGLPNADMSNTPLPKKKRFGVLILANILSSFLNNDFIRLVPKSLYYLFSLIFIYGTFTIFLFSRRLLLSAFIFLASIIFLEGTYLLLFLNLSQTFNFMPIALTLFFQLWYTTYLNYHNINLLLTRREVQLKTVEEVSQITKEAKGIQLMRILLETIGKTLKSSIAILREKAEDKKNIFPLMTYYLSTKITRGDIFSTDSMLTKNFIKKGEESIEEEITIHGKFFTHLSSTLKAGEEVVGILSLYREGKIQFKEDEKRLFATLLPQVSVALKNLQLYRGTRRLFLESIQALTAAIDAKDPYTEGHSERVTELSLEIAKEVGLTDEEIERLKLAALLHDIGKIGIEERILRKRGQLTEEEYRKIKSHPEVGAKILLSIRELKEDVIPAIRSHHERWDGKGYPYGLKGKEIPLFARIISIADTFDAITSDRPYRKGKKREEAIQEIIRNSGTQFDPEIIKSFQKVMERKL